MEWEVTERWIIFLLNRIHPFWIMKKRLSNKVDVYGSAFVINKWMKMSLLSMVNGCYVIRLIIAKPLMSLHHKFAWKIKRTQFLECCENFHFVCGLLLWTHQSQYIFIYPEKMDMFHGLFQSDRMHFLYYGENKF